MRQPTEFPGWETAIDDPFELHWARHRANGHNSIVAACMAQQDVDRGAPPPLPLAPGGPTVSPARTRLRSIDGGLFAPRRGVA